MEKAESDNWKNRVEKEFAEIARERSDVEKFWQKIEDLQINMNSKTNKSSSILKKIKEKILPLKKTDGDKTRKRAEIQRERIALERKKEELRRKKEELAKKKDMLKN